MVLPTGGGVLSFPYEGRTGRPEGNDMKAIDRAAYWTHYLEQAGFDIERETSGDIVRNEYLTVRATKGYAQVMFVIQMNTPRTRFITGASGYHGRLGKFTNKPSEMSLTVSLAISAANFRAEQEVTS
jgi:hypothetical protein